ncbi:hypothetical protein CHLRE_09g389801v5 [Chlamydomonas reinhardtii]|uniref:Uncharacterized protein n=1 Tax=Chlamydomonas reinhardtii TaxID=3055 RepID=A0A2K3DE32_CHLRE|nr:uncharacterized protein CHLRE_09g389801v5 [Chlamydomonas reinhardtii]XP_042921121.1 uncharacterized protein CHLRE_09g389801v5 [Chlamydomonas reinhardtii]PNW78776.1 hypothetical protein CHLRE_09g389801v5 [Chlamydomonas reinhardtii]PNW78777.1 hypothetical protein CHLRE_09g389801v5 [Chlamydomonas reinhardtii]
MMLQSHLSLSCGPRGGVPGLVTVPGFTVPNARTWHQRRPDGRRHVQWRCPTATPPQSPAGAVAPDLPGTCTPDPNIAAWELLRDFTLKEFRGIAQAPYLSSAASRQRLREALKLAYSDPSVPAGWLGAGHPDVEVLLGVVASDVKFAARAYRDWCEELQLELVKPDSRVDGVVDAMQVRGGVYLKYNSKTKLCYVSRYDGKDRGVLIQLGQLQLGHFPLGFFDEAMSKPPPSF